MKQAKCVLMVGIFGALSLAMSGCGPSATTTDDPDDGEETGPGPGPDPTPVASCASPCVTDLAAARGALTSGDYQRAFNLYSCADTPEAAFGAGLTRTLLAFDGNNADAVLADLGQPPLPMTDIFGSNGALGRAAGRWSGEGNLVVSGSISATLPFDRAQYQVSDEPEYSLGYFIADDTTSLADASLNISFHSEAAAGALTNGAVLAQTVNCTSAFPTVTADPRLGYVDLSFDVGETNYWCGLPYSIPAAQCQPDGGSLVVVSVANTPGQQASYQFNNLLLSCYPSVGNGTDILVRVNGTASAVAVSESLDLTGLHPIFQDGTSIPASVPAGATLTGLMQHGGAAAAELEEAACFFKIASQGTGQVYDVPGELFGGSNVPVSKGDTEIVAAFALLGAAAGHLAWVHEIDLPLGRVICDSGDPAATPCYNDREFAAQFNRAFASSFHPGRMLIVERLVAEALPLLDQGIADLDANSLLARTAISSPGLDALRTMVQASLQSIQTGNVALPHVSPALTVNFKELFESPRNPQKLGVPPLLYTEECDVDYCWTSTELDIRFVERYFDGRINADWEDGSYEWSDDTAVSDAFEEIGEQSRRYVDPDF